MRHGGAFSVVVRYCPVGKPVSLALSDGQRFSERAASSGEAVFRVSVQRTGKVRVLAVVDHVTLAQSLLVSVT